MAQALPDALAQLVAQRWDKLVYFARVKLRHPDPEDLVQRAIEHMLKYPGKTPQPLNLLCHRMAQLAWRDNRYGYPRKLKPREVPYNEVAATRRAYPRLHGRRTAPKKVGEDDR